VKRLSESDGLGLIWVATAARCGLRVVRTSESYASYDGNGILALSVAEHLDADDSLAQMVLHELCHALVMGDDAVRRVDWGLSVEGRDALEEHATHRVQAALADRVGMRAFFAVTTDWRPYWDALPADPLEGDGDPAIPRARAAFARATRGPWAAPIADALDATAQIARIVGPFAGDSLWMARHSADFSTKIE
jgi:hypothetical protein